MRRAVLALAAALILASLLATPIHSQHSRSSALVIKIDGTIDSSARIYFEEALRIAEENNQILVVELNTPGGLVSEAEAIVRDMITAPIPVVVFVYPTYAYAKSAGTYLLLAAHVAAMAPLTTIGSMQPIYYDPVSGVVEYVNETKIINHMISLVVEVASFRGRNTTAARLFITENLNLDAVQAYKYRVIDVVANNLPDLLAKINGTEVMLGAAFVQEPATGNIKVTGGRVVRIMVDGSYEYYGGSTRVRVLKVLTDPFLSSMAMTLGVLLLIFGLLSGHFHSLPIAILLVLIGLLGLGYNVNYTALFLLLLGAALLFAELFLTPGFGVMGATGIAMISIGIALMPFGGRGWVVSEEYTRRFLYLAGGVAAVLGGFTAIAVYKVLEAKRKRPVLGGFEGRRGRAVDDLAPGRRGFVLVEGEYWMAEAQEEIRAGEEIVVVGKQGPVLVVRRASDG